MVELSVQERLQPSLLDRLRDDEPENTSESVSQRVLTVQQLRRSVQRDLGWLLNATNLGAAVEGYSEVRHSVLNYGIPDLAGYTLSSVDADVLEKAILRAFEDFEPRLIRNSIRLSAQMDETSMGHNTLVLLIECDLWAFPTPLELLLRTKLNFETGDVELTELASRSR